MTTANPTIPASRPPPSTAPATSPSSPSLTVSLLDYGAGNVRSVRNAITSLGYNIIDITSPTQIKDAQVIVFPGVGSYHAAMEVLKREGYDVALREYLLGSGGVGGSGNGPYERPFLGICLGMQTLFEESEEVGTSHGGINGQNGTNGSNGSNGNNNADNGAGANSAKIANNATLPGLGIIPGKVIKFDESQRSVPHIGWNGTIRHQSSPVVRYLHDQNNGDRNHNGKGGEEVYFVHSYYAPLTEENQDWVLTRTTYEGQEFISSIQKGCVVATQFHPEKSGKTGLNFLKGFLESVEDGTLSQTTPLSPPPSSHTQLVKRVVVALDVRSNDSGDLVVTKGDQYDVRENSKQVREGTATTDADVSGITGRGGVRNLGKPVQLASRYYEEGADEIAFLNITSFRSGVIDDMPMLQVLEEASKCIFVPLTVGGGIRSYVDEGTGRKYGALEVASRYFRAGADKVSIGSDAVYAAEEYLSSGGTKTGQTSIETISRVYGVQAVVISIDPKRVYVPPPTDDSTDSATSKHTVVELPESQSGPNGERHCWYQCTVKGGREPRSIDAVSVAKACAALGAGEIMLNCIDMDGQCKGFDHALMRAVSEAVTIPVIASSGAGTESHFSDVFSETNVQAALAAGMFHRKEVEIGDVKRHMEERGIRARISG